MPTVHLSDLGSKASRAKYKVGQEVRGRVLERDVASKRIVMTLKKALIGSKLPAIVHLEVRGAVRTFSGIPLYPINASLSSSYLST